MLRCLLNVLQNLTSKLTFFVQFKHCSIIKMSMQHHHIFLIYEWISWCKQCWQYLKFCKLKGKHWQHYLHWRLQFFTLQIRAISNEASQTVWAPNTTSCTPIQIYLHSSTTLPDKTPFIMVTRFLLKIFSKTWFYIDYALNGLNQF